MKVSVISPRILLKGSLEKMKKILLILLLALTLCSCGVSEEPVPEEPQISESSASEAEKPEKIPEKTEDEIYYESLDNEGKNMYSHIEKKEINYNTFGEGLLNYGILMKFKNIRFIDDWYYSAVLVLEKAGTEETIEIPVKGIYYHSEFYGSRMAPFGGFCYPENEKVYFCGLGKIVEIDPKNFSAKELELDFPEKGDLWISAIFAENGSEEFYLAANFLDKKATEETEGCIWAFDKDGKLVFETLTENRYNTSLDDYLFPFTAGNTQITKKDGKTYLLRTGTHYVVDAKSGEQFYFSDPTVLNSEEYELWMTYYYPSDKDYSDGKYRVSLYKSTKLIGEMDFKNEEFVTADNIDEAKPQLVIPKDGKTAVYVCDYFAIHVTFDFEKGTATVEFSPTDKNITDESYVIDSADGKYSICSFGGHGGGDIYYDLLSVRNNETKGHKYLGQTGGMYGGGSDFGFLKNNDIYIFGTSGLRIFDPETGEVKFDLDENFPLGYNSETDSERGIITFRRDPNDFSFIVLYFEYENGFEWDDNFLGSCNYKIGFLDPEGNLLESYDTECPLHGSPFGICPIDMRYSESELRFFGTGGKGGTNLEAVFDMETKEFKVINK